MLWKILSALSAICLAAGLWFSYQNKGGFDEERRLKERSDQNLKAVKADQIKMADSKIKRAKELDDYTKQRDDRRVEIAKVNSDITDKQKETEEQKKTNENQQKEIGAIKTQIEKAGDIKKFMAQVKELDQQLKESEAAIANREQQKAIIEEKLVTTSAQLKKLQEVDSRQRRGQIEPGLTARVTQTYQNFGFVVLNKGNSAGVYPNNMMEVKRGKNIIAKVRVRDVEMGQSVADVVPGSLARGESVQPGDLVVAAPRPPDPVVLPSTSPAPAAPPASPPPAIGADPLGGVTPPPAATPDPAAPAGAGAAKEGAAEKPVTADPFAPAPQ